MSLPVMIDLEFLDLKPTAAIIQIGLVKMDFEKGKLGDEFFIRVDADDCVRHGMTIGADTVRWWINQDIDTLRAAFAKDDKDAFWNPLAIALVKVANLIAPNGDLPSEVWACGTLDQAILEFAFSKAQPGMPLPWQYGAWRDFRTLREEFPHVDCPAVKGTKHNALDDAKNQAKHLIAIRQHIASLSAGKAVKRASTTVEDDL